MEHKIYILYYPYLYNYGFSKTVEKTLILVAYIIYTDDKYELV